MSTSNTEAPEILDVLGGFSAAANITQCDPGDVKNRTFFYVWILGIIFCIIFIVVQKRSQLYPKKCTGRPGLPVPVDLLVSPRNRFVYAVLFGIMGVALVNGFSDIDTSLPGDNIYLSTFNKMLWTPFITVTTLVLQYFPLFTAVEFPYPLFGYIAGLIYAIIWFLLVWIPRFFLYKNYANSCGTSTSDRATIAFTVLSDGPYLILCGIALCWYVYKAILYCIWRPLKHKSWNEAEELDESCRGVRQYHLDYVRCLLKKDTSDKQSSEKPRIQKIINYLFPFQRNYKLPLPLVGAIVCMVMIIYQLTTAVIIAASVTFVELRHLYDGLLSPLFTSGDSSILRTADVVANLLTIGFPVLLLLSPILAVVLSVFLLIHMIASISKDTKRAAKYGFQVRLPPLHRRLSAYWKFLGAQIGLFVVAWFLYFIIIVLIGVVLVILGILLALDVTRKYFFTAVVTIGIPIIWSQLIIVGQTLLARFVFLGDRNEESKFIVVKFRQLYNWFGFVLFFYNGLAGIVTAVFRVVFNIVFGILLLFRLDVQFLPAHLWKWDLGHKSYLGFIYMHYCYNNAVVYVFCHLLGKSVATSEALNKGEVALEENGEDCKNKSYNKSIRNRWLVAYTLIKNPSIQRYTSSNISLLIQEKELEKDKVFLLEHAIQDVETDMKEMELKKKAEGDRDSDIDIGIEITEDNSHLLNLNTANGMKEKESKENSTPHFPSVLLADDEGETTEKFHDHRWTKFN